MDVYPVSYYRNVGLKIPIYYFDKKDYFNTLSSNEETEFTIWILYQDQYTLQIASEYYLMNHKDKNKKNLFDSMRRMFSTKARIKYGRLCFEFNTDCGISKDDLKRAVSFIEDGFVKIGLRN